MAEREHEFALFRLGLGAHTNQGKPLPRFLRRAAQLGIMQTVQKLGTYYCERKEFKKAHHWLSRVAKKGDPESQHMLGLRFEPFAHLVLQEAHLLKDMKDAFGFGKSLLADDHGFWVSLVVLRRSPFAPLDLAVFARERAACIAENPPNGLLLQDPTATARAADLRLTAH